MKPKTIRQDQGLLFQSRLSHLLNPEHELLKLSKAIPWDLLEAEFASLYSNGPGQPPIPIRLATGLMILQHMFNVSDERVVEYWVENPTGRLFADTILSNGSFLFIQHR